MPVYIPALYLPSNWGASDIANCPEPYTWTIENPCYQPEELAGWDGKVELAREHTQVMFSYTRTRNGELHVAQLVFETLVTKYPNDEFNFGGELFGEIAFGVFKGSPTPENLLRTLTLNDEQSFSMHGDLEDLPSYAQKFRQIVIEYREFFDFA